MSGVLSGFFTIWFVIALGWLAAHVRVFDTSIQTSLSKAAFYVGLPALLFNALRTAQLERIFTTNVIVSVLAIAITLGIYVIVACTVWKNDLGHTVIGGFGSCYVNANNILSLIHI